MQPDNSIEPSNPSSNGQTQTSADQPPMAQMMEKPDGKVDKQLPCHPGDVLINKFLTPLGLTQGAFAKHIGVPVQRVNEIVHGKRGVTPETAWLFAQAFGTTPEYWANLQMAYDLARHQPDRRVERVRGINN
ncbi:MAG: HigA family addiction module antitoxin [Myxococcota bacterium]